MNRKNLTAAVLAGLAGAAGIAATAQAVNINPDGVGQVLLYPYYTANNGNQTVLSVVNTTDHGKAVKVRFLEGFNSREVLDFNLYLSAWDVWVAAIGNDEGTPTLYIPDSSCTVPYLFEQDQITLPDGQVMGQQPFLKLAYSGSWNDGGPDTIARAAEGHIEMIEMGTIEDDTDTYADIEHVDTADGRRPRDCAQLTENWTDYVPGTSNDGIWFKEADANSDCDTVAPGVEFKGCVAHTDTDRNSGGMFGGAAIINADNGTMFSYDAEAIQGFDKSDYGIHYIPGTIYPSLNSGDQTEATVFFGVPQNKAVTINYDDDYEYPVDAVSAVFMHEHIMNEYVTADAMAAGTEWVVTFPTRNFYADAARLIEEDLWEGYCDTDEDDHPDPDTCDARPPFTRIHWEVDSDDNRLCEVVDLKTWDREEDTFVPGTPSGSRPPVVSPSIPGGCNPDIEVCETTVFQLCNEVNVLRFGERSVFGTPMLATPDGTPDSLLLSVEDEFESGWGRINFGGRTDGEGLVGLPVAGFAANVYENGYVEGASIKAYYGGLFGHKANVRRIDD